MKNVLDRIQDIRNKYIPHSLEDYIYGMKNVYPISFKELEKLRDYINLFFNDLTFGIDHMMLPVPYSSEVKHPEGSDPRPDIEKILDSIAKESGFLNIPENYSKWPTLWRGMIDRLSEREKKFFIKYRKKLGFPDIKF